jgi:hypothetical protein
MTSLLLSALLIGLAVTPSSASTFAAMSVVAGVQMMVTKTWVNASGGTWQIGSNWTPMGVPAPGDSARFVSTVTAPVTLGTSTVVKDLAVESGDVQLSLGSFAMTIDDVFNAGFLNVGTTPGGVGSFKMSGSSFNNVSTPRISLGSVLGSSGSLTLSGVKVGFVSPLNLVEVGAQGHGSLSLEGGAILSCTTLNMAVQPTSSGAIRVSAGSLIDCDQSAVLSHGIVTLLGTGELESKTVAVFPEGAIAGHGKVDVFGCSAPQSAGLTVHGIMLPGDVDMRGLGVLTVDGDYKQFGPLPGLGVGSGSLIIDATTSSNVVEHDSLAVTCQATLGGLLELSPLGSFDPPVGTEMLVLTAASLVDVFDVSLLPGLPGRVIVVEYNDGTSDAEGTETVSLIVEALNGGVAFSDPALAPIDGGPVALAAGDIDGEDDFPDLAFAVPDSTDALGAPGTVVIWFDVRTSSAGELMFVLGPTLEVGTFPAAIVLKDIDGNGRDDIAVANSESDSVDVYLSFVSGRFERIGGIPVADKPLGIVAAQLDGAPGLDLAVANAGSNSVSLLGFIDTENDFAPFGVLASAEIPCDLDPPDIDGDGDADLLVSNNGSSDVGLFINDGDGRFTLEDLIPVGAGPIDVGAADLNGDGLPEIITSNINDGTVSIVKNETILGGKSTIAFAPSVELPVGAAGSLAGSLTTVDVGEDEGGDIDIALVAADPTDPSGPRLVRFLRNDTAPMSPSISFAAAATLSSAGNPLVIAAVDLDDDQTSDLVVLNQPGEGTAGLAATVAGVESAPLGMPSDPADLDGDGCVGPSDLAILLGAWGGRGSADLDANGNVGPADLTILLGAWSCI